MQGIVIYKGKYGATKQYAEWLGENLNFPIAITDDLLTDELRHYDLVLLGTSIYYGKFKNASWMKQNIKELSHKKKIIMFIVSATPGNEKKLREKFILKNVPPEIESRCEFYFLPGRIIHEQLSFTEKLMLKIAGVFEENPLKKRALYQDFDEVKKENLRPLINNVNSYLRTTDIKGFDLLCSVSIL